MAGRSGSGGGKRRQNARIQLQPDLINLASWEGLPSLTGSVDDEARQHLVLRYPCRRQRASPERGADVDLAGVVPDEQAVVDHVEVPLVQPVVSRALPLVPLVPEEHDPARADDADHVGDDSERIGTVVQRVDRVCDVERTWAEVLEELFARDATRANRRFPPRPMEHGRLLAGGRVERAGGGGL